MSEQDHGAAAAPGSGAQASPRRVGILLVVAVAVLTCDIVTKTIVVATLSDRAPLRLLGGLLTLRVSRNPGAAFSIGPSMTVVFSLIAAGVIIVILRTSRRIRNLPWAVTLGLLLGGATGNLTDRIFRSPGPFLGYVVDWIQVPHWPVFNVADSSIVCGGVLAVFLAVRGVRIDGPEAEQQSPADAETAAETRPTAAETRAPTAAETRAPTAETRAPTAEIRGPTAAQAGGMDGAGPAADEVAGVDQAGGEQADQDSLRSCDDGPHGGGGDG